MSHPRRGLGIRGLVGRCTLAEVNGTPAGRTFAEFAQVVIGEARRLPEVREARRTKRLRQGQAAGYGAA